jgi:hypothetical protein
MVEVICGFEGEDAEEFIVRMEELWSDKGTSEKGSKERYELLYGSKNYTIIVKAKVSTRGLPSLLISNLEQQDMQKIISKAKKLGIPISAQPYLWFDRPPAVLSSKTRNS